jgi:hypothetical protein
MKPTDPTTANPERIRQTTPFFVAQAAMGFEMADGISLSV